MMINWVLIWLEAERHKKDGVKRKADPWADPLQGPEWQGLLWALPALSWLAGCRWRQMREHEERASVRPIQQVAGSVPAQGLTCEKQP